jgi:hypothetical protein
MQNVAFTSLQEGLYVTPSSPGKHSKQNINRRTVLLLVLELLLLEVMMLLLLLLKLLVLLMVQKVWRWLRRWWMVPGTPRQAWTLLGQ